MKRFASIVAFILCTNAVRADDPNLPLNNNMPMAVLRGDTLHLLGGETGGAVIDGEAYGHHPDLYLIGKLRKAS
jgi:hypothetical protein